MLDQNDLKAIAQLIHESETRLYGQLHNEIEESEQRTKIFIENRVEKKIDSLFDGYKLVHEKQWELERSNEKLQEQMDSLQARLAALEKKISA